MKASSLRGFLLLAALVCSGLARAELPENYKVVLLTENFPPFNMAINDKNFAREDSIDGISAELVREMFRRAKIDYVMTLRFPWDRIYRLTQEKPGYGLFSTSRTPERENQFKWVGPLGKTQRVLMAKTESALQVGSLAEAAQYRVGAYKNSAVSQMLEAENVPLINALRDQENIKKLTKGQIDLWATNDPVGRYLAKQEGFPGALKVVYTINESNLYLALNLDTPDEVIQRLQQALDQMRAEGYVDDITNSYL
ncbi:polar amino acid transport system substrate-binding protein [Atopomonas hussainii]|uniref:Polar amino acid transport system substrate-binding protein n=1 Tax=Atopomonas hussainii TaxID=1429083 RepID=A0A1H7P5R4_9GAMM|nr:ABC transporter substrate-binding protein [Atopomonas hussainii]SEL30698.1 polar amino acid transport system substrate-binding protein [Atopomonas hussainii]